MTSRSAGGVALRSTVLLWVLCGAPVVAQELEPAAYVFAPVGVNVITVSDTFNGGDIAFDPAQPIEDASARINTTALTYTRAVGVAGHSGSVTMTLPFVVGTLDGRYFGTFTSVSRSGVGDARFRMAVNVLGAPARRAGAAAAAQSRTRLGASLSMMAPLGQYSAERIINIGTNRWSFKPELGLTHEAGRWTVDVYGGVWLFTENREFLGEHARIQEPIVSTQFHVLYTFRPRLWASMNANFYAGGRTKVDGVANFDLQKNSRVGATLAVPLTRRQSLRVSASRGAYTTIGADFSSVGVAFQHLWGGGL